MTAPADALPARTAAVSATGLWDRAIVFARRHFAPLLTLAALGVLLAAPAHLVPLLLGQVQERDAFPPWPWMLYQLVVATLVYGAFVVFVAGAYVARPVTVAEAARRCLRRAPGVVLSGILSTAAVLLGLILLVLPGLWFAARLFAITAVVVLEDRGALAGARRSWQLSRGNMPMLLGTVGVATLVSLAANFALTSACKAFVDSENAAGLLASVLQLPLSPFVWTVTVLAYLEVRQAREGDDIERALEALPAPDRAPDAAAGGR